MANLHKVEFYLVEWNDELNKEDIAIYLENCFQDHGIVHISSLKSKNIGEWHDNHKFNLGSTSIEKYEKEFE